MSISQNEYEVAKQKVEAFEKRQKQLDHVKKELTKHIDRFNRFKFRVDKDTKTVFFAGVIGYDLKVGIAKAKNGDVFDVNIGKLIAIKKSLGENTRDVEQLVESEKFIFQCGGRTCGEYKKLADQFPTCWTL